MTELDFKTKESEVLSDDKSTSNCHESLPIRESPNDFLEQIEVFDSSGLTTSLIEFLNQPKE